MQGLTFDLDVRSQDPDANAHRKARFTTGWKKAAAAEDYGEGTLRQLTWDNLGWRLGKLLGPASEETIGRMYRLCVDQQHEVGRSE